MTRISDWLRAGFLVPVCAAVLAAAACGPRAPRVGGLPETVDFNFHVKPILSDRCFKCHGPDDRTRKAGLRLDTREGPFARLESGRRAVVPGSLRRSELVRRVLSTDPAVMMPAPDSHLSLSDYEKALLVRWVEQGAEWKPHWALIPPRRSPPPQSTDTRPHRTDLDAFVVAALRAHGLAPAPEAARETLIRRVTFDLTGLPPTPEEIDAFVADRSPGAYERVVDRLLASPAYGERMASEWLDVARFADSHGYQDDGMRDMSPWRDWVIDAFNRNMRFDQFVTWQLAGDLLPNPTREQLLATGFNRNHMQSQEGGIVLEEYRTEYVADRVNTLGRAFLGISIECARCHDHKYDPVSQQEYYRLFAFFNSINESGQAPYAGIPSPSVILSSPEDERTLAVLDREIRELEARVAVGNAAWDAGLDAWLRSPRAPIVPPPALAHLPLEGSEVRMVRPERKEGEQKDPKAPAFVPVRFFTNAIRGQKPATLGGDKDAVPRTIEGRIGRAQQLVGDSYIDFGRNVGQFERHEPFSMALWLRIDGPDAAGPLVTRSGGIFNGNRGYEVILRPDGTLTAGLHHVAPDNSLQVETTAPVGTGVWRHLALTYDGSSRAGGLRVFLDGAPLPTRVLVDNLRRSILHKGDGTNHGDMPGLRIGKRHDETLSDVAVDEARLYDRQLTELEVRALARAPDAGSGTAAPVDDQDHAALREHYVLRLAPGRDPDVRALTERRRKQNALLSAATEVMTMRELPTPRPTFVLARGAYDAPTDPVEPGTPASMPPLARDLPRNRLGLARWLLDPGHPLTARVLVNRYWGLFFGTGLVATPEDFGSQGELPSHPELLDYLALTFVDSGWNLKALQKRIVMSATYRQSSLAGAALLARDPGNRLLARGPSYRRSAEQIRDAALAVSGLLARKVGGPSVYPYQPPGLWEELATRNATTYVQGTGDDLYRRSLYTVWKRTTPPPSAISFDAADRLYCSVRRQRTSTPLQALVLLNDPQYVEAARVLAERMLLEGGATPAERLAFGFRAVTSRRPTDRELAHLERLQRDELARFTSDPDAAGALLSVGERPRNRRLAAAEVASYAVAASTLFSLDEAVNTR